MAGFFSTDSNTVLLILKITYYDCLRVTAVIDLRAMK